MPKRRHLKEKQAEIGLERAAYHLVIKEDLVQCIHHLKRAVRLAPHAIVLSQFKKEVEGCKRYEELVNNNAFQSLEKDNGLQTQLTVAKV